MSNNLSTERKLWYPEFSTALLAYSTWDDKIENIALLNEIQ
jgi:hypothetical protein